MIKIFSNKTTVPNITVQSKFLKDKTTFLTPNAENGLVEKVRSDTLLFVKVQVNGVESGKSVGKIQLALAYVETPMNYRLKVLQCPKITFTEEYMKKFAGELTGREAVIDTQVIYGSTQSKPVTEQKEVKYVTLDLTNLNKLYIGDKLVFMFAIKNDSENDYLNLLDPEYVASQVACCNATLTNFGGLNGMYKFDKHSVGDVGTGYINLFDQKLSHIVDGLTSLSKKMPITYSTIYNFEKTNEKSFLENNLTPSFQYKISKFGEDYIIEDPTGNRNYYSFIDRTSDSGKETMETHGIGHTNNTGSLYFCSIDNSYFYLDATETNEIITLYDKEQNETTFEVSLNIGGIERFTKLFSRKNKFKDAIYYIWSGTNLEKIMNSEAEEVLFSYDTSNRITKVDFKNLNQYIEYTYQLDEYRITIATYSYKLSSKTAPELTKLKEVQLDYIENVDSYPNILLLSSVVDKITGDSLHYTIDRYGIVESVSMKNKQDEIGYQVIYSSSSGSYCTKATSFDGKKHFYYFDNYGRCKLEMDDKGRSITYNYDEFENGESKHLTSASSVQTNSRNLLENHSFEDSDNLFKENSTGWKKSGDTHSILKSKIDSVYGEKYLSIDKVANETITIFQDIVSPEAGKITLRGLIKHQAKNATEEIVDGNIKIRVKGTYTRVEDVIVAVNSTTTATETRAVNHYYNKELSFGGNSDWEPFFLTTSLPNDAYNITLKVEIIVSGVASEVGIDALQLYIGKQKTRYNLIENGYMEFTENNLPKGWSFSNKEEEDTIIEITASDQHPVILGKKVMRFKQGDVDKELNSANFKIKKMYKEIISHGLAGEQLVFSVFAKALASSGYIFRSYIKIYHTNGQYRYHTFDFDKNFRNWQMLTRSVTAEYDFEKVEIGVEYSGGKEALFDCFQLYKDSYGKYYSYDERGNITEVVSEDGNAMRIDYDEDNQIKEIFTQDGSSFKYNYDSKGRLERVTDLTGNVVTIKYDEKDYVIQTTITTPNGEMIINSQERDKWGEITKAIDEHGNQTLTGLNYLNQITQISHPNGLTESFNYNKDLSLNSFSALVDTTTHKNSFSYDDAKQMKTVESANGTKYNLEHDSFGRLTKVVANGEVINQFSYNEVSGGINKGLVSRKQYGVSGDYFDFLYDEDDQITSVKLNGEPIVNYQYNEDGQVSEIHDKKNNTSKYFTYDFKGNLIKVVDSDNRMISHTYDNLDNVQKTTYQMENITKSFDYEYEYETNEYTKEGYFNRIEKEFGDEVVKGGMAAKGTYGAKPVLKKVDQVYDDELKMKVYQFSGTNDFIWYKLETFNSKRANGYSNGRVFNLDTWKRRFFYNKTFYMWIKPTGTFAEENLFKFQKQDANKMRTNVATLNILSSGKIGYKDESNSYYSKTSTSVLKLNEWNLVGVKIFKKENESNCKCILFMNDEFTSEFTITTKVNEISNLIIASQKASTTLPLQLKVCMMSFGAFDYTKEDIKAIYLEGLKYLVNPIAVQKAMGVSYYNADVYKDFDVITLNGSLESTSGKKPIKLMKTDSSFKVDKARIFKYDPTIQRHVYGAFDDVSNFTHGNKPLLAYYLNLKNRGMISFKFKVDEEKTSKRYILSSYKESTKKLAVLTDNINNSESIYFEVNGQRLACSTQLAYNHWYNVMLCITHNNFKIFVDGNLLSETNISLDLTDCITYIGSLNDGTSTLNGYVEMLAYSNKEVASSECPTLARNIFENGNTISIRNKLDSLGRVKEKVIQTNKSEYKTTYEYDKLRIHKEIEPENYSCEYQYDETGNIIKKQYKLNDTNTECISYKYDELNRLIEETHPNGDIEAFTYDANGNILTHQVKNKDGNLTTNEKYNYSTKIKDQLLDIQDATDGSLIKVFEYKDSYKGNPTAISNDGPLKNLIWDGRRLKQIGDATYTYNEDGIRIKKHLAYAYDEDYILDGNRMIALTHDSANMHYTMYFNYDEQGELIGLSYEGKEYFYIRDITGNITKIVDEDGIPVVKYTYDAWGNFKKTICVNCLVASSNPFVYKGYFFDEETKWYYLKSRYYDPSIRRFINADGFGYLDTESLTGLNLYSYCGNNPILGYDPEGTWNWKKFIMMAAVCVAVVVGVVTAGAGALVVTAAVTTGVILSVAAGEEEVAVLDLSLTIPIPRIKDFGGIKIGFSFVLDFENMNSEVYFHAGVTAGFVPPGASYSVGIINNYDGPGSYGGWFVSAGGNVGIGVDHCFDPRHPYNETISATSITFGSGYSTYGGIDYYWKLF